MVMAVGCGQISKAISLLLSKPLFINGPVVVVVVIELSLVSL